MEFLYLLEKIRIPVVNELMLAVTKLGEETAFLVIGLLIYWCVNKRRGYYVMSVGLLGTVVSQAMKIMCRVPRPWVLDKNFTIIESARKAASGYSFPSGHTQTAVGTFGSIALTANKKWVVALCLSIAALVGFSRMYLGVHTPADVLVGAALSVAFIFLLYPLMMGKRDLTYPALIGITLVNVAYLIFLRCAEFPADIDMENYESAMKNVHTLLGATAGLLTVYPLEKRFVNFSEKGGFWVQTLKVVLGLGVLLAIKEGLKAPLDDLFHGHLAARALRYYLIVVVAGLVWPMTFRFFSRLDNRKAKEVKTNG